MQESISSVQSDMQELKQALLGNNENPFPALSQPKSTFAQVVKSSDSVIIINNHEKEDVVDRSIISEAAVSSKAGVSSAYKNKQGNTVLVCESEAAKKRLAANLKERVKDREILQPKERTPTIRIAGMEQDYPKPTIFEFVKVLNHDKGIIIDENNFKILFTRPHAKNPNLFQAIVRVSNEVRAAMERAGDKLHVDLSECPVFDHFHIRRCNKCQGYNHFKDTCKEDPRCGKCAGAHDTEQCNVNDQPKCINCVTNNFEDTAHHASNPVCKSYKNAQKKLEQTIGFYKTKN